MRPMHLETQALLPAVQMAVVSGHSAEMVRDRGSPASQGAHKAVVRDRAGSVP